MMNEREAFEEWWRRQVKNPVKPIEYLDVWQAACAYQRKKDAEKCISMAASPGHITLPPYMECAATILKGDE